MSKNMTEYRIIPTGQNVLRDEKHLKVRHTWSVQCEFKQGADMRSMFLYPIIDTKLVLK